MRVFKYYPPYKPNGRTNFPETQKKAGVYLIKENGKLVYVGYSSNDLYKTLYRHFQVWTEQMYRGGPREPRLTYIKKMKRNHYTVRVILCSQPQAARLEKALIIKYKPRDNSIKYENYTIDHQDVKVEKEYFNTDVSLDCPF